MSRAICIKVTAWVERLAVVGMEGLEGSWREKGVIGSAAPGLGVRWTNIARVRYLLDNKYIKNMVTSRPRKLTYIR